ncbi:hypothetical protein E8E14_012409 [Neopestalotiopsis sp. 37M]|nr:hypothetical protein E8E14_012409 [Neopestalotiopsis sp. 37M]
MIRHGSPPSSSGSVHSNEHVPAVRATKVMSTGELSYSTTPMPAHIAEPILSAVTTGCALSGLGYLQLSNTQGVVADSMWASLATLRNNLDYPREVSTPHPAGFLGYFVGDPATFREKTEFLTITEAHDSLGNSSRWVHPEFESLRARQVFIWAIRVGPHDWRSTADDKNAHWCLVIGEIDARPPWLVPRGTTFEYTNRREEFVDIYYDRSVRSIQIFDPLIDHNQNRDRLESLLEQEVIITLQRAGIACRESDFCDHQAEYPKVSHAWQTGFQCFGIAQEYMRRLNVRANFGLSDLSPQAQAMMTSSFVGLPKISVLRESMVAACATRAVIQSEYKARIAVELPGRGVEADTVAPLANGGCGDHPPRRDDPDHALKVLGGFTAASEGRLPNNLTRWGIHAVVTMDDDEDEDGDLVIM